MKANPKHGQPVSRTSADLTADRLAQLKDLFPEAFSEGKVDFAKLRAALGDVIDERPERYTFTWAGKPPFTFAWMRK
jgi:adenine-specific DNA-methyltransferase